MLSIAGPVAGDQDGIPMDQLGVQVQDYITLKGQNHTE